MFELITNANVFAPAALGIRHVLVCGGRIAYIGEKIPRLDDSLDVSVTDLDGARLVPGLIDAHTHLTGGGGEAGPSTRVPPLALGQITSAGVTSVVGLLGTDDLTRSTQNLLSQVMGLREEGLSAWCYTGGYHVPPMTLTGSVRSDIVNLEPVIGVGEVAADLVQVAREAVAAATTETVDAPAALQVDLGETAAQATAVAGHQDAARHEPPRAWTGVHSSRRCPGAHGAR